MNVKEKKPNRIRALVSDMAMKMLIRLAVADNKGRVTRLITALETEAAKGEENVRNLNLLKQVIPSSSEIPTEKQSDLSAFIDTLIEKQDGQAKVSRMATQVLSTMKDGRVPDLKAMAAAVGFDEKKTSRNIELGSAASLS